MPVTLQNYEGSATYRADKFRRAIKSFLSNIFPNRLFLPFFRLTNPIGKTDQEFGICTASDSLIIKYYLVLYKYMIYKKASNFLEALKQIIIKN
jgi:hypothetical protein